MSRTHYLIHGASLLVLLALSPARGQDEPFIALELPEAQALASTGQPLLEAQQSAVLAARESAVAAGQLPDPQLNLEIRDVPANGPDAYSFTADRDTQFMVGVAQEFPPGDTRRLRGTRAQHEAEQAQRELDNRRLQVRRDAGLAWLALWQADQTLQLLRATEAEAQLQSESARIAYGAARATQAELLAARIELDRVRDDVAGWRQQVQHARNALSRWIGPAAFRPLCPDLPGWGSPPESAALLARVREHPHLATEASGVDIAATDVELARQAYRPGWRAGIGYGYRPEFPEMLSVQFGVDLPVFTSRRQDRGLAAAHARREQAQQMLENRIREHEADVRLNRTDWELLQQRLVAYDRDILPRSAQRVEAAMAAWRTGQGTLATVLEARRMALENRLRRLELQVDAARHRLNLQYFAGDLS